MDSITNKRNPIPDNDLTKKHVDVEMDKNSNLRNIQRLEKHLKISTGNDTYNLTNYDKIQIANTTIFYTPNSGRLLLQQSKIDCIHESNNDKRQNYIKS